MSYQLNCPNCGKRTVSEFTFRSEYLKRPAPDADFSVWVDYVYFRKNKMGIKPNGGITAADVKAGF